MAEKRCFWHFIPPLGPLAVGPYGAPAGAGTRRKHLNYRGLNMGPLYGMTHKGPFVPHRVRLRSGALN